MAVKTEKRKLTYEELLEKREIAASKVDMAFLEAQNLRSEFLLKRGWDYHGEFPDGIYRWSKTVKGHNICLSAAEAFEMERNFITPMDTGE